MDAHLCGKPEIDPTLVQIEEAGLEKRNAGHEGFLLAKQRQQPETGRAVATEVGQGRGRRSAQRM